MNCKILIERLRTWVLLFGFIGALQSSVTSATAATYRVGDVAENFSFVARLPFTRPDGTTVPAGATVNLYDFAGHIVFLEWFAVWCPYCVAAAPQVRSGIEDYYASREGNPSGLPVMHVAVNQEARSFYQSQTDSFVAREDFGITVNDYDHTSTNRVRFLFQSSGQPTFAVINGVTNSASHKPWEILVNHLGYGETDFSQELANFRAVIDQVKAPIPQPRLHSPRWLRESMFAFDLQIQPGGVYRLETSTDLTNWIPWTSSDDSASAVSVLDDDAWQPQKFYRAVIEP